MPRPHLFLRRHRPAWHYFAIGCILGLALLAALEYAQPWHNAITDSHTIHSHPASAYHPHSKT